MPELDFYHGLYSGQQVDEAVSRALVGGQLDQDIAAIRAAVGSPLVANTAADMTNINKIYVYTGSEAGYSTGHWYYYEGGSWHDGGLYNSAAADSAMSPSSTNAVQNKVIKAYVDSNASSLSQEIMDAYTDLEGKILAEKTRAENVEALKAPLASPALTGTPTAPTASPGDNSTQIATTAYVDAAVAVEKARAEAVEATKADQSFAEYILLREEEDRQILFGSVVEAAEDSYPELRSAPIHNAITIGGSVYPRMDRTRMAIDRMLGRTVSFNQLCNLTVQSGTYDDVTITVNADHSITVSWEAVAAGRVYDITAANVPLIQNHVYYAAGGYDNTLYITNTYTASVDIKKPRTIVKSDYTTKVSKYRLAIASRSTAGSVTLPPLQLVDLTAQYGTTLADSIYAMEQATTGAGVAYVRQRMDLDYYAANAGELVAPVVSGVSVTGFNLWDEEWENGAIVNGVPVANPPTSRSKNFCLCIPDTTYYVKVGSNTSLIVWWYDEEQNFTGQYKSVLNNTVTAPSNAHYFKLGFSSGYGATYKGDTCVNISSSRNGEYQPYQHTSLPLPSTRLDGVGDAQDVMYVREDAENDYSIVKMAKMELVDLGTLEWVSGGTNVFAASLTGVVQKTTGMSPYICPRYVTIAVTNRIPESDKVIWEYYNTQTVRIKDTAYSDPATFKTAMSGVMLAFEKATPTETVIAEHLTLAEISAIAENGGIISVVNSNGDIVQPDMVCDVVISRSAS